MFFTRESESKCEIKAERKREREREREKATYAAQCAHGEVTNYFTRRRSRGIKEAHTRDEVILN